MKRRRRPSASGRRPSISLGATPREGTGLPLGMTQPSLVGTGLLKGRLRVVLLRLARWNAQETPRLAPKAASGIDDLAHVVAGVGQRPVQGLMNPERLAADRDGPGKIRIR